VEILLGIPGILFVMMMRVLSQLTEWRFPFSSAAVLCGYKNELDAFEVLNFSNILAHLSL